MPRDAFVLKIQRELCHPKCTRKVSGLSRNRPQDRILEGQDNIRPVARKILQPRHYFKRCARIEFYKLLALYHAESKIVVYMRRLIYFLLLHRWCCLRLNLLNKHAKNKQTKTNQKKTGNFNQGECPGSPHTGYDPEYSHKQPTSYACIIYQHMHAIYVNNDFVPCEVWQNFMAKCLATCSTNSCTRHSVQINLNRL